MLHRPFWSLPVGDIAQKVREALGRVLDTGRPETLLDVPFRQPTGETRHVTLQVTPLRNHSGDITGVVGVASPLDPGGRPTATRGTP